MQSKRNTILCAALVGALCIATAPVAAQERAGATRTEYVYVEEPPRSRFDDVISFNVLDMLGGTFNIAYERAVGTFLGVHLGLDFLAFEGVFDDYDGSVVAAGPSFGLDFFLIGDAPTGFFLGPYVIGSWVRATHGNTTESAFGYALGGRLGVAILLGHLHLSAGCGALWRDYSVDIEGDRIGPRGFAPRFELGIGVAF